MIARADAIEHLRSTEPFDLVVVGGGITGAGVALDAASRGFSVALVEKADFASGTSSRSSKLVHGAAPLREGDAAPARLRARDLELMAFHPLGTAGAGADPRRAVVDGDLRLHGVEGLYVADGSAVPTSLGVNPQITIMALATRLAYGLLGAPAPDEPAPERLPEPRVPASAAG